MEDKLLSPATAAAILGVTPETLAVWRSTKRYPLPYVKFGRSVRYKMSALTTFIETHTFS
ncbi:helix-turn-helix domain-containing protein [Variovorax paradoxus]|uniref:helix-turn-helix domain-containing protein n=1 Tax=Variovorax paradoxus TaxID=34073 RepID=UPI0009BD894F|nr:helix-turn-helix domain-containing protein [Variovorax paradoxus]